MTRRKPSPRIIPGGDFAYDLDRIEARRTGRWPDVPMHARARSHGALASPTNELVERVCTAESDCASPDFDRSFGCVARWVIAAEALRRL